MIETKRLYIIAATEEDIETIIKLESHVDNRKFIWNGTFEGHKAEIYDKNHLLFVFKRKEDNLIIGFALIGLNFKSEIFELRRIAISDKGKGYGKEALAALLKYAFEELKSNRFWLDVYPDNAIGIKLYEGMGMHCDGVLRQNYKSERGYLDQKIYSMLKSEYFYIAEGDKHANMKGKLHHIEIYVKDLNISKKFWGWLLGELGYKEYQKWEKGISYSLDSSYIVFVQAEERFLDIPYNRCRVGLNHLAFHGGSREFVDDITLKLRKKQVEILYEDRHPHAGGPDSYIVYFEDPDRIKVEITSEV